MNRVFSDPPPPQAFFRSDILDKTSDNLLYLLVDLRMGPVAHSEHYIFILTQGTYLKPKVRGTLIYLYVIESLTFSSVLYLFHLKTLTRTHY